MTCKICFSRTKKHLDPLSSKRYAHCLQCQCIALEPSFWVTTKDEKKQYDQHQNSLSNEGYVKMFEDFLDFFWKDILVNSPHVLDFGSGPTPVLSTLIQKRGALVSCYDKFYQPDTIFDRHTYDLITSTEVFEHLENPLETLQLLAQHLNTKGYIAIMTLFHDNSMENFWKWWYRRDPTHIIFYTPLSLISLAKKCGLEMIKTDNKRIALFRKL